MPVANDVFACVFAEHVIEHIPYTEGAQMIRESFRVLRPGGRLPPYHTRSRGDLLRLLSPQKNQSQRDYID